MRAAETAITVIDFEGTGSVRGYPNAPWQIGLVEIVGGAGPTARRFESLLHVGDRPFNPHAPGRHAEVREQLRRAPGLPHLWPALKPLITNRPLVAHGIATEKRFLTTAFPLQTFGPRIDTVKLARMAYPRLPRHTLEYLLDHLGLTEAVARLAPGRGPHDALYDAYGCAVFLASLLRLPDWSDVSIAALASARPVRYHSHRRAAAGALRCS
jgi:DNA polymerase-3 subunit epsilon